MLREGIKGYEFLYLLRERLAKRRGDLSAEEVEKCESLSEAPSRLQRT